MSMSYAEKAVQVVWDKGRPVPGRDPALWREDACGALIYRGAYGDRDSALGWEVDHIMPKSRGGSDETENLRPLHHENNTGRVAGPLRCIVTSSGGRNIRV